MFNTISNWIEAKHHALAARAIEVWVQKKGQGTTEYAILVGVLTISDSVLGERGESWNR